MGDRNRGVISYKHLEVQKTIKITMFQKLFIKLNLGLAKLTQKIYIFINNLFLYSNLHTSYKILIDLMNIESSTQRHLR